MPIPIYHITHVRNLPGIMETGRLWSDRHMSKRRTNTRIGYDHIKRRRLEINVPCHPGTKVGDYVPFYFCPRSVMLFVIDCGNAELTYKGGQHDIVHLVSTVEATIETAAGRPWAYSDGNAGACYTAFHADVSRINDILDRNAISARDWREPAVKNRKQAEFLVHDFLAWEAFHEIGVIDESAAAQARDAMAKASHQPPVNVHRDWYY